MSALTDDQGRRWRVGVRDTDHLQMPAPFDRRLTDAGRVPYLNTTRVLLEGSGTLSGCFYLRSNTNHMTRVFKEKP